MRLFFPKYSNHFFIYMMTVITVCVFSNSVMAQSAKADHTTVDVESFTQAELDAARALRITTNHASVGRNLSEGITALGETNESKYATPNWNFNYVGNGPTEITYRDRWLWKLNSFKERVAAEIDNYDVFGVKFCWVDSWDIDFEIYRDAMLELESTYPDKVFIWWTNPLWARELLGNDFRAAYNALVRDYCEKNDKPLYDVADISSHDPEGNMEIIEGYEAFYEGYTYSAADNGHFNAAGSERLAKGFWNLMVQIASKSITDINANVVSFEKAIIGISIYTVNGEYLRDVPVEQNQTLWNTISKNGNLESGIYIAKMTTHKETLAIKFLVSN
ncbi:MAG: T9SS type A sorting domain-containing protein [Fibrobacteria bacterium]|nr:T9SS type A sorting domain-containing protein [Fibrobacteria bacterium]